VIDGASLPHFHPVAEIILKRSLVHLPLLVTVVLCALLLAHGPIPQLENYHQFADRAVMWGVPNGADVFSNLGFALVAAWGLLRLWPMQGVASLDAGRHGYRLFLMALLLTSIGSSFYHLAPDNARLVWDRIPIALACAGLLAAVRAECLAKPSSRAATVGLSMFAIASVAWWAVTERQGAGDLRPYQLLQGLPLVLIPLWQWLYHAPRGDKLAFGCAIALYGAAKCAELGDHALLSALGVISGHALKHLLAAAAAAVLVARLVERQRAPHQHDSLQVIA
jgi:hypothetical protein